MIFCSNSNSVSTNFISSITICSNSVCSDTNHINHTFFHKIWTHSISNQCHRNSVHSKFKCRNSCTLLTWSCFICKNLNSIIFCKCWPYNTQCRPISNSSQSSCITMSQNCCAFWNNFCPIITNFFINFNVFKL